MNTKRHKQIAKERNAFLASPIAWSVYFVVVYLLVEAACRIGLLRDAVEAVTLGLMLPTLAVIGYVGLQSRSVQGHADEADADPTGEIDHRQMQAFAGQVGIWMCGVFALLTLAVGVSALALPPC